MDPELNDTILASLLQATLESQRLQAKASKLAPWQRSTEERPGMWEMAEGLRGETAALPASKSPKKQILSKAKKGAKEFMERKMPHLPVVLGISGEAWSIPVVQVPLHRHPALPDYHAQLVASVEAN